MDPSELSSCNDGSDTLNSVLNSFLQGPEFLAKSVVQDDLEDVWEEAEASKHWEDLEEAWDTNKVHDWSIPKQMSSAELCEIWQTMWPMEELHIQDYMFEINNPYIGNPNAKAIAEAFILNGDINNSLLALESVVIHNPEDVNAWILIGKFNAENDEDARSISALYKAYEIDNYSLEAILSLGISLINGKQQENALKFLLKWIETNPNYLHLNSSNTSLYEKVIDIYTQASNLQSDDSSLFQVLGALYFMGKEYDLAVSAFSNAVEKDSNNYYCWNRLGAALAHKGDNLMAIQAYQKALELRPGYVRAWANLGIAHTNIDDMVSSARYYLCALSYNPKTPHIWNYLFTSFACMSKIYIERFDLLEKIKAFNISVFEPEFQFLSLRNLPLMSGDDWAEDYAFENK
jgi:peroxin-5